MANSEDAFLRIDLETHPDCSARDLTARDLTEGLLDWLELGLLDEAEIRSRLWVDPTHPAFLEGLNRWIERGLYSETQVRDLCATHLTCAIALQASPETVLESGSVDDFLPFDTLAAPTRVRSSAPHTVPPPLSQGRSPRPPAPAPAASWLTRITQSLMAELSVLWLLLLGIALVVLSSGVLAARQWQLFPPAGQYAILWIYTLIFGGTGLWLRRRSGVQLTAQALQMVSLLLLPVNMVAMERVGLTSQPLDLGIGAIATLTLTGLTLWIGQGLGAPVGMGALNYLGLSYLHWGWAWPGWAIAAVYGGIVLTGGLIMGLSRRPTSTAPPGFSPLASPLSTGLLIYGILVLLGRSLFIEQFPLSTFALAIGLCGALMAWIAQQSQTSDLSAAQTTAELGPLLARPLTWEWVGGGLIGLGWLIALEDTPWQAIALSGLGLWFFGSRYRRFNAVADWGVIIMIGLQLHVQGWRVLPATVRETLFTQVTQATATTETPWALWGLVLLPFLSLILGLTVRLHRASSTRLLVQWLIFGWGTVLTLLSLASPITRTLNLGASTLLLLGITWRVLQGDRPPALEESGPDSGPSQKAPFLPEFTAKPLIYLTHLGAVLTLLSLIDGRFPQLGFVPWIQVAIALTLLEWGLCYGFGRPSLGSSCLPIWISQSAWHLGLGLAVISYGLLGSNLWAQGWEGMDPAGRAAGSVDWGLLWLLVPAALTGLGGWRDPAATIPTRSRAFWLSTVGLLIMPGVTIASEEGWLWSLAIALGLMLVNAWGLQRTPIAAITLGFGLMLIAATLNRGILGLPPLQEAGWLILGMVLIAGLWGLWAGFQPAPHPLKQAYAVAAEGWAIALMGVLLLLYTNQALYSTGQENPISGTALVALVGLGGAIAFRYGRQANAWSLGALAWALELLVVLGLPLITTAPSAFAVANVALGLGWGAAGETQRRSPLAAVWNGIPLTYGLLAILFRLDQWTIWTGWTTLGVALILLTVGRRGASWRPLGYLGLVTFSLAAAEIADTHFAPTPLGDRLVVLAAVSVALIGIYRWGDRRLAAVLHLDPAIVRWSGHLHWGLGTLGLLLAIPANIQTLSLLALITGFLLTAYALEQGRHREAAEQDLWVYLGIAEACGILIYLGDTLLSPAVIQALLPWVGAIAAGVASGFYLAPWTEWGWTARPWRRAAVALPLVAIALTLPWIHPGSLLIAAACYTLLAQLRDQIRLTYLSILLVNWAIARWVQETMLDRPMLYASLIGLSLLYLAQVDPNLQDHPQRQTRHWVRSFGVGIIGLFALLFHHEAGIVPAIVGAIAIFAGLVFKTRAFLYMGTITFLLNAFYQLVILIFTYALLKWIVGLIAGIALIWIAATFETRRDQVGSAWQQWRGDLGEWE